MPCLHSGPLNTDCTETTKKILKGNRTSRQLQRVKDRQISALVYMFLVHTWGAYRIRRSVHLSWCSTLCAEPLSPRSWQEKLLLGEPTVAVTANNQRGQFSKTAAYTLMFDKMLGDRSCHYEARHAMPVVVNVTVFIQVQKSVNKRDYFATHLQCIMLNSHN